MFAAGVAALNLPPNALDDDIAEFKRRRDLVLELLEKAARNGRVAAPPPPEGAFYVFCDVAPCLDLSVDGERVGTSTNFCKLLLKKRKLALVPGDAFGAPLVGWLAEDVFGYDSPSMRKAEITNGRVTAVKTNRGRVECGSVVQAVAGASSIVAKKAGIPLPIHCYPLQAMVTQPYKPILTPHVSSPQVHVYVHQTSRGEFVIGGGSDPYPLYNTRATLDQRESLSAAALELFPFLAQARLLRQWAGTTDMTPDYSPIMGLSPVENYYLDAGWGTWGFKATPICGVTMAELVATKKVPDLIKPFELERFYRFEQINEAGATAASH